VKDPLKKATDALLDPEVREAIDKVLDLMDKHTENRDFTLSTLMGYLSSMYENPDAMVANVEALKFAHLLKTTMGNIVPPYRRCLEV
jgi:hypothetical protein